MRSPRSFWGSLLILLAVPAAVLAQVLLGGGSGVMVHVALAAGALLIASAVFDFGVPAWANRVACAATVALAAIFLLQAASDLVANDSLTYLAYTALAIWPERLLVDVFILWLVAVLLLDSRGWTRILGFVTVAAAVGAEVYGYALLATGTPTGAQPAILRALYLLPVLWLLVESGRREAERVRGVPAAAE